MNDTSEMDYEDDPPHPRYHYQKGGGKFDGAIKQVGVALIITAIVGFVSMGFAVNGAISNLRETQAVHTASLQFLREQMAEVKGRQDRIEGKVFRSHSQAMGLDDADERQSK